MIIDAIRRGFSAAIAGPGVRALAWTYGACLLFGLALFVPIFSFVRATVGASAIGGALANGATSDWIVDLAGTPGSSVAITSLFFVTLVGLAIYVIAASVVSGGVIAYLAGFLDSATQRERFLSACGRYAGALSRIALLELPILAILVAIFVAVRFALVLADVPGFLEWAMLVLLVFSIAVVTSVFDYARIDVVVEQSSSAIRSVAAAFRYTFRNLAGVVALAAIVALLSVVVFVAGTFVHGAIPLEGDGLILLAIVVGQISIAARLWARLVAYGFEIALWLASRV